MDRYNRIIREEINKFILSEALDVSVLSKYIQPLKKCASNISSIENTKNKEIEAFFDEISTYILQVIFGIERCIRANSLNEDFRFSDYGIHYPAELGGNFLNDFERGFYKGSNWVNRQFDGKGGSASYINRNNVANGNFNQNTVPSVRLAESLRKRGEIAFRFKDISDKYPNIFSQYSAIFIETIRLINQLNIDFENLKTNAQGNNP